MTRKIHIFDPTLCEVYYHDGRVDRVPEPVIRNIGNEEALEVVTLWAKITKRIAPQDEIAMLPAA
ncbi:hypothetical protein SVA_3069 [Sulfurifustis variabilis]|uniref:Uncharacterized protein n=1 Tax=Sulfurifustis variabilis TaxID=1675686 RepID=A0A1B4VFT7_9GAMM|nr:hypothetical protein [Sulfurifustis variabilis]BAU49617.1 hypothetical protein SVA_3069 [Sulfurifustis variabilis]